MDKLLMNNPCSLYISMDLSTILNFVRVFRTKPNISRASGIFVPNRLTHTKHKVEQLQEFLFLFEEEQIILFL